MTTKSTRSHSTPRDVFLHLLSTLTLLISVISALTVIFQYINLLMPDPLNFDKQGILSVIRGASSSLIVGFPIFIWLSSILHGDLNDDPAKRELGIRKWLIYFTLLIAAVAMIIYLINLVGGLYGGDLSLSFALKTLSVFALVGLVFGYYLWDVKQVGKPGPLPKQLAMGSGLFVITLLIAGIFIAGTPSEQRRVRFDSQRTTDLQSLQGEIVTYWTNKDALPTQLSQLADTISGFKPPVDPETKLAYEFKVIDQYTFELCATFTTKGEDDTLSRYSTATKPIILEGSLGQSIYDLEGSWAHNIGRTCFKRTIDPDRYKPQLLQ